MSKCPFLKRGQALRHFLLQQPNALLEKIEFGPRFERAETDDGVPSAEASHVAGERLWLPPAKKCLKNRYVPSKLTARANYALFLDLVVNLLTKIR